MTGSTSPASAAGPGRLEILSITPEPTESERAAIAAAVEALSGQLWPQLNGAAAPAPSPRWRYAGRQWQRRRSYGGWR